MRIRVLAPKFRKGTCWVWKVKGPGVLFPFVRPLGDTEVSQMDTCGPG